MHYLWAPGAAGDNFSAVHEKEFGDDDIEKVRLFAMNAAQPCGVNVRLIDVRIVSGGPAAEIPLPREKVEKAETKGWLLAGLILGLVFIVTLALGTWLVMRLSRRADTTLGGAEEVS